MTKSFTTSIWFFFVVFILGTPAFGQKNYVPGYLILPPGDTVKGFVDDQNWDRNPKFINFKNNLNTNSQHFTVRQLTGFGIVNGDQYLAASLFIDKTPVRVEDLSRVIGPVIVPDTVFLLEQVDGNVKLYHLLDENHKHHFFIQSKNGAITELIRRNYLIQKEGQQVLGTYDQYKDQLRYSYLLDCPGVINEINKTEYKKAALTNLITKYNHCLNPEVPAPAKIEEKEKVLISLIGGMTATSYNFTGDPYYFKDLNDAHFDLKTNMMAGIGFQILLPRNRNKFSLYNELAFKRNYSVGENTNKVYYREEQTKLTIKANYVGLTSMLRYSWLNSTWQPFVNAGFALNQALNVSTVKQTKTTTSSVDVIRETHILEDYRRLEIAAVAGIGARKKRMTAEIRMEKGNGYLNTMKLSVSKNMLAFLLGYNFN